MIHTKPKSSSATHVVVGGEFASTVGDEGPDDVAISSVQDMGAIGTEEVRGLVETSSHGDLFPSARSKSISSFHTVGSIRQVSHFQRDQL